MSATTAPSLLVNLSVPGPSRDLIERAAASAGQSVDEFAAAALVEKAEEVLRNPAPRRLSAADARRFLELLDADAAPNDALRAAARRFPPRG